MTALLLAPAPLPEDPFVSHARAVVDGRVPADAWKVEAYRRALKRGVTVTGRARRTNFCLNCDPTGKGCDGSPARPGTCATDPDTIPVGSFIWTQSDGLLKVTDTGGKVSGKHIDVWFPQCPLGCADAYPESTLYAVLSSPKPKTKHKR